MKQTFPVVGMACSACSANVERKLASLPGVASTSVSLVGRSALVDYDPSVISPAQMKKEINELGYDLVVETGRDVEEINRQMYVQLRRKAILSAALSLVVMALSMHWVPLHDVFLSNCIALVLALANLLICGRSFYSSAWRQLRHGSANMDTLVALSTLVAFLFSTFNTFLGDAVWGSRGLAWHTYFDASTMIISFVLIGRCLEERAKDSTADSIRRLMGMQPKTARIVNGDAVDEVPVATIEKGDILEVRAGEKIPVDGVVTNASSFMKADAAYVDESMITGEPTPAEKKTGDKLLAGTIPSQGRLHMKAQQVGGETALAQIIRTVQEAQNSKAPVQRIADKVAFVFVPIVVSIAIITFFIWWAAGGSAMLPQAILSAVAVLVIACPCALGLATPTALMVGIGKAAAEQVLIKDAAALESLRNIDALVIDKTGTLTIPNQNIDFTKADNIPLGERETLKPHASEAVHELLEMGIDIFMMSGDKEEAAAYWAGLAGIPHHKSRVLPEDKEALVRRLQDEGHCVAMVGDGINDTQALAHADVSMAIGRGTDVAMDVAQVTLLGDDLRTIPTAVRLSRRTVRLIRQNLFWAFIYNLVCIPLAAGALYAFGVPFQITPMWASALMAFSSLSVILNSLRIKWFKSK